VDSVCKVYAPYQMIRYNVTEDTYRLACASVNGQGDTVQGIWPSVCSNALAGAWPLHPATGKQAAFVSHQAAGSRWTAQSIVYVTLRLDLRTGALASWYDGWGKDPGSPLATPASKAQGFAEEKWPD